MAVTRLVNPDYPLIWNTNLLGREGDHLLIKGISDGTVKGGDAVEMLDPTTRVVTQLATTHKPIGVAVYRTTYAWGSTAPAKATAIPANVEIDICINGAIEGNSDQDKIGDTSYFGCSVCCDGGGGKISDAAATEFKLGYLLDLRAGNNGTGTGGADDDPIAIMVSLGGKVLA